MVVEVLKRGCGYFGGAKPEIYDLEYKMRWFLIKKKCWGDFLKLERKLNY